MTFKWKRQNEQRQKRQKNKKKLKFKKKYLYVRINKEIGRGITNTSMMGRKYLDPQCDKMQAYHQPSTYSIPAN